MPDNGSDKKTVSIVIPVFHNGESLPYLMEDLVGLETMLSERGLNLELIFVDDGSTDNSFQKLTEIKQQWPRTKVIKLTRNFGAIAASRTGFRFVTGDCFGILAADRQDPVEEFLRMVDSWLEGNKFTICVRTERHDPLITKLFARIYYKFVRLLVIPEYPRGGFDLMLLDKELLPHMLNIGQRTHPNLFAFWLGYRANTLSYVRRPREHGHSGWTFGKKLRLFVDTTTGFSVAPIRALSRFGMIVAFFSFLYGIYIIVNALAGSIDVRGFPTLVVLITFFSGLILVMLGSIGEYLSRVLDATQNKPESVIEELLL